MAAYSLLDLLDELAPDVQAAFIESIARLTGSVKIRALEAAIASGDTEAVVRILALDRSHFAPLDIALRDAYEAGGAAAMAEIARQARAQGAAVNAFFSVRNERAEAWLRAQSSSLIEGPFGLEAEMRESVRQLLTRLAVDGTSPRTAALELVGRINRATGKREGGIIGLNSARVDAVNLARAELRSGDPVLMRNYLKRTLRDRRFDGLVQRAIAEGRPLSASDASRLVNRYEVRQLASRGLTVARTELLGSLGASFEEGLQQAIDRGDFAADQVTGTWDAAEDSATRESHRAMDNQVKPHGEPFVSPVTQAKMLYPGDRSLGAPGSEIINCRCVRHVSVDFTKGLADRLTADDLASVRAMF